MITYIKKRNRFTCPHCKHTFELSFWKWLNAPHLFDVWRYAQCPKCNKRSWVRVVRKED